MVTHYIITNREVTSRKSEKYFPVNDTEYMRIDGEEEARHNLRYGKVSFNPKKAKRLEDFKVFILPDVDHSTLEQYTDNLPVNKELFPSTIIFDELFQAGLSESTKGEILVFVHGFKNDMETALQTLADLHRRYVEPENSPVKYLVLFAWPAKSKILKYRSDAQDAEQSGFALARSFATLREFFRQKFTVAKVDPCEQRIHLMCHSMGNRVLNSMVGGLTTLGIKPNSVFAEILLVGADIDYDALEEPKPLYRLIDLGERIHVYFHGKDKALGISETTKNSHNRLGKWGAKNTKNLPDDVYQYNVTSIRDDNGILHDTVHHWYYTNSKTVVKDILEVLNGGKSTFNSKS
jgi:esterase/lipase superfamily enzyme